MTTENTTPVSQDNIDFFLDNFSKIGRRYIFVDSLRKIENFKSEIKLLEQQIQDSQYRLQVLNDKLEGEQEECRSIQAADEAMKKILVWLLFSPQF